MKFKKIVSFVLPVAMSVFFSTSDFLPYMKNQSFVSYASESVNVAEHTEYEIEQYIESHPFDASQSSYTVQPSTTPYEMGELDDATKENALNALNCMRYIAGLPEVTLNEEYGRLAQAAAFLSSLNGYISHYPEQPEGLPDDIYSLGAKGASESNLSIRYYNLAESIVKGYMGDSNSSNISAVGHRRWCLNPSMAETGFGNVGDAFAMYAIDRNRKNTESNVCWPAQNMPKEYFPPTTAWSISLNKDIDADSVTVELVRNSDGKQWNFSSSSSDGDFYISNEYCGEIGCIIFRPSDISYNDGDKFNVKITTAESIIEYSVDFFSLGNFKNVETFMEIPGDIDNSKNVDVFDLVAMREGFVNYFIGWSDKKMKTADVNDDSFLNIADLVTLQKYLLGQIENFD